MSLLDTASLVITPNGYKASKLYSVVPSDGAGDMTVTRATTATRVNSAGLIASVASNVPRLDYSNGTCPSILVEPQRTNNFLLSEQFDNSYWLKYQATVTPNTTVSPDGNTTADTVTVSAGVGGSVYLTSALTGTYTVSIFMKAGTSSATEIEIPTIGNAIFNLSAGTFTTSGSVTGTITSFGSGWYRCTATFTGTSVPYIAFGVTGAVGLTANLWGAQLEAGSYATSYIPTVASAVTRNVDVISKTGISSLIGQTSGTVFIDIEIDSSFAQANARFLDISSNNYDNWYFIGLANTNELVVYFRSNSTVYASALIPFTFGRKKIAFAYANNDYVAYMNGALVHTDTSVVVGSTSKLTLANDFEFTSPSKQFTNSVALWKTRLTNTQLASLTTI